jgi:Xaa-Pro aminopeptidase
VEPTGAGLDAALVVSRLAQLPCAAVPDVLMIGDSERSMELRHEIPVAIGDDFAYAEVGGRRLVATYSLEHDNVRRAAPDVELRPLEEYRPEELVAQGLDLYAIWPELAVRFVRDIGLRDAVVPASFPLVHADRLRREGVELTVDQRFFDDRRRVKSGAELDGVRRAQRAAEAGMAAARELLRRSQPGEGGRVADGEPLTCERVKEAATAAFDAHGCRGDDLIAARGPQAASGHDHGSGRIGNDDVLVCDFFPRHVESGCFSDMTRTFAVGEIDPELESWHAECREALELAVSLVRPGVDGREIHAAVDGFFAGRGHPTALTKPVGTVLRDGFFHATGHGVGLQVHESPNIGRTGHVLVPGDVIALEPGLYRQGWGGVRLEDLVLVTDDGCEVLTDFPYDLAP